MRLCRVFSVSSSPGAALSCTVGAAPHSVVVSSGHAQMSLPFPPCNLSGVSAFSSWLSPCRPGCRHRLSSRSFLFVCIIAFPAGTYLTNFLWRLALYSLSQGQPCSNTVMDRNYITPRDPASNNKDGGTPVLLQRASATKPHPWCGISTYSRLTPLALSSLYELSLIHEILSCIVVHQTACCTWRNLFVPQ